MSERNKAGIAGKVSQAPVKCDLYGRSDLYKAHVTVCRNSGLTDDVIVVFEERVIDTVGHEKEMEMPFFDNRDLLTIGKDVLIMGRVQTMRNAEAGIVDTFIYADYIGIGYAEPQNDVYFVGTIEREPKHRKTPKGRNMTDLIIRIPSEFASSFFCKVPVITWGKLADEAAALNAGDEVEIYGRLQSRVYVKRYEDGAEETKIATEVSASNFALYKKK